MQFPKRIKTDLIPLGEPPFNQRFTPQNPSRLTQSLAGLNKNMSCCCNMLMPAAAMPMGAVDIPRQILGDRKGKRDKQSCTVFFEFRLKLVSHSEVGNRHFRSKLFLHFYSCFGDVSDLWRKKPRMQRRHGVRCAAL